MDAHISGWAAQVKKISEESLHLHNLEREAEAVKQLNKQRDLARRTKPPTEQIEELMASLPPAVRDRPWTMAELTNRLQGKYRDRPHPQMVGMALRALGWRRVRLYGKGFDGARVWQCRWSGDAIWQ